MSRFGRPFAAVAPACSLLLFGVFSANVAFAGDLDDTVFLKGGGRLRGLVVEESPATGVRVKLPDGTLRTVAAGEVDHVAYGGAKAPPAPPPPVAAAQVVEVRPSLALGTIHIESHDPATVSVGGGDFGKAPADIPNLPPGKTTVTIRYDDGVKVSRVVFVRAGVTTPVVFEPRTDLFHQRVHFGMGIEPVLWYFTSATPTLVPLGTRAVGRVNVDVSRLVALHFDAVAGALYGTVSQGIQAANLTYIPFSGRVDLQLNVTDHYAIVVGVDVGAVYESVSFDHVLGNGGNSFNGSGSNVLGTVGAHGSFATFRFGEDKQYQIAAQEGFVGIPAVINGTVFEQTLNFTYLFGMSSER